MSWAAIKLRSLVEVVKQPGATADGLKYFKGFGQSVDFEPSAQIGHLRRVAGHARASRWGLVIEWLFQMVRRYLEWGSRRLGSLLARLRERTAP